MKLHFAILYFKNFLESLIPDYQLSGLIIKHHLNVRRAFRNQHIQLNNQPHV